ncbi:hypothetical protein ACFL9T_21035 [Thermodesulfobacteriota bacterium]
MRKRPVITSASKSLACIYRSKDGNKEKGFDALEWPRQKAAGCPENGMQTQELAAMPAGRSEDWCSHVPNKGE